MRGRGDKEMSEGRDRIDEAMEGAAAAPLVADQRRRLAILCRNAHAEAARCGLAQEPFDVWRHRQVMMCCERDGLRECRQEDYAVVEAHMHWVLAEARRLSGREQAARRQRERAATMAVRAEGNPVRQARWKLRQEFLAAADVIEAPEAYAAHIARSKFRTAHIEDLSARQVWSLVFDLRRAAAARRKRKGARA